MMKYYNNIKIYDGYANVNCDRAEKKNGNKGRNKKAKVFYSHKGNCHSNVCVCDVVVYIGRVEN